MAKPTRCTRCGRENDPSLAFCLDCGQSLREGGAVAAPSEPGDCPACGEPLQPSFRFCGQCGHPVGAPRPPPRAPAGPTGTGFHGTVSPPRPPAPAAPPPAPPRPAPPRAAAAPLRGGALRLAAVRHDGLPGTVFALPDGETLCGRTEGELRLADDATISPRHARFTLRAGRLVVDDLGGVNGTYLRIQAPRRLSVGEEFRLGRQLLRLEPLPPPPAERGARPWGAPDPGYRLRLSQLLEGGGVGEVFPLREGENTVGRDAGEVTFPGDRYVSARHARVDVFGGAVTLTDVGSSNGTFVRIAGSTPLEPGDQLLVGGQLLRVEA